MLSQNSLVQGQQTSVACGPNQTHHLFLYCSWAKDGFYIFKWLKENQKKKNILWHILMKIIRNSNFSIQNFLRTQPRSWNIYITYDCFLTTSRVDTDAGYLQRLKYLLSSPLQKKFADLCSSLLWEAHSGYWGSPRKCETLILCNHRVGDLDLVNSSSTAMSSIDWLRWISDFVNIFLDVWCTEMIFLQVILCWICFYNWKAGSLGNMEDSRTFNPDNFFKERFLGIVNNNQLWMNFNRTKVAYTVFHPKTKTNN